MMKFLPVISATALITASMSALTKLSVTGSSAARLRNGTPSRNASIAAAIDAKAPRRAQRKKPDRCEFDALDAKAARIKLPKPAFAAQFDGRRLISGIIACASEHALASPPRLNPNERRAASNRGDRYFWENP
jgi:hypothetical protein